MVRVIVEDGCQCRIVFIAFLFAITTEPPCGVIKHETREDFSIILTASMRLLEFVPDSNMDQVTASPVLTIFVDGKCPLCKREARWMARRDRHGRLDLVDISDPEFFPPDGITLDQLMGAIHARAADGQLLEGMDVFRAIYRALGLGWILAPTGWPLLRPLSDCLYRWFARNRLRLTGRTNCRDGSCKKEPPG